MKFHKIKNKLKLFVFRSENSDFWKIECWYINVLYLFVPCERELFHNGWLFNTNRYVCPVRAGVILEDLITKTEDMGLSRASGSYSQQILKANQTFLVCPVRAGVILKKIKMVLIIRWFVPRTGELFLLDRNPR